jgi:putative hydrolase of the HAD superfamily
LLGLSADEFLRRAHTAGFLDVLKDFESGRLSSEAFQRRVCEMTGLDCDFERFAEHWRHIFWANEPVHRLIDGLRALGHTIVLGSNTNPIHADHFRTQFAEVLRHFDRLVLSYEVGHVKPSPEFYIACAAAAGRPPGECVFIDDLAENVQGATDAGLIGVHYTVVPTLLCELSALGVEIPSGLGI